MHHLECDFNLKYLVQGREVKNTHYVTGFLVLLTLLSREGQCLQVWWIVPCACSVHRLWRPCLHGSPHGWSCSSRGCAPCCLQRYGGTLSIRVKDAIWFTSLSHCEEGPTVCLLLSGLTGDTLSLLPSTGASRNSSPCPISWGPSSTCFKKAGE